MSDARSLQPIVLYLIERHPLQQPTSDGGFRWIGRGDELYRDLEALIGSFSKQDVSVLVDETPAGAAWDRLLDALLDGQVSMLVTHLAPLTSAQRQQLIGLCDQYEVQLITPADAGRNLEAS